MWYKSLKGGDLTAAFIAAFRAGKISHQQIWDVLDNPNAYKDAASGAGHHAIYTALQDYHAASAVLFDYDLWRDRSMTKEQAAQRLAVLAELDMTGQVAQDIINVPKLLEVAFVICLFIPVIGWIIDIFLERHLSHRDLLQRDVEGDGDSYSRIQAQSEIQHERAVAQQALLYPQEFLRIYKEAPDSHVDKFSMQVHLLQDIRRSLSVIATAKPGNQDVAALHQRVRSLLIDGEGLEVLFADKARERAKSLLNLKAFTQSDCLFLVPIVRKTMGLIEDKATLAAVKKNLLVFLNQLFAYANPNFVEKLFGDSDGKIPQQELIEFIFSLSPEDCNQLVGYDAVRRNLATMLQARVREIVAAPAEHLGPLKQFFDRPALHYVFKQGQDRGIQPAEMAIMIQAVSALPQSKARDDCLSAMADAADVADGENFVAASIGGIDGERVTELEHALPRENPIWLTLFAGSDSSVSSSVSAGSSSGGSESDDSADLVSPADAGGLGGSGLQSPDDESCVSPVNSREGSPRFARKGSLGSPRSSRFGLLADRLIWNDLTAVQKLELLTGEGISQGAGCFVKVVTDSFFGDELTDHALGAQCQLEADFLALLDGEDSAQAGVCLDRLVQGNAYRMLEFFEKFPAVWAQVKGKHLVNKELTALDPDQQVPLQVTESVFQHAFAETGPLMTDYGVKKSIPEVRYSDTAYRDFVRCLTAPAQFGAFTATQKGLNNALLQMFLAGANPVLLKYMLVNLCQEGLLGDFHAKLGLKLFKAGFEYSDSGASTPDPEWRFVCDGTQLNFTKTLLRYVRKQGVRIPLFVRLTFVATENAGRVELEPTVSFVIPNCTLFNSHLADVFPEVVASGTFKAKLDAESQPEYCWKSKNTELFGDMDGIKRLSVFEKASLISFAEPAQLLGMYPALLEEPCCMDLCRRRMFEHPAAIVPLILESDDVVLMSFLSKVGEFQDYLLADRKLCSQLLESSRHETFTSSRISSLYLVLLMKVVLAHDALSVDIIQHVDTNTQVSGLLALRARRNSSESSSEDGLDSLSEGSPRQARLTDFDPVFSNLSTRGMGPQSVARRESTDVVRLPQAPSLLAGGGDD